MGASVSDTGLVKRTVVIDFDDNIPAHWFDGDVFLTRYFDSFSLAFPALERFMIEVVRDITKDLPKESIVKKEAKDFIFQEAQHSIVHDKYNERIRAQGVKAPKMERFLTWSIGWMSKNLGLKSRVAVGAGIEHFTSLMAEHYIASGLFDNADPKMRALWEWHSLEELEHKHVLFDIYKGAGGGYARRSLIFVASIVYANYLGIQYAKELMESEGIKTGRWFFFKSLHRLFNKKDGVLKSLRGPVFHYFKPSFHPNQIQVPDVMHHWAEAYEDTKDALTASLHVNNKHKQELAI